MEQTKIRLLRVLSIIQETDEDHPITANQIVHQLHLYGMEAERKSVLRDIAALQDYGYDVLLHEDNKLGYYLASREFEDWELKVMMDAVAGAGFLTSENSENLCNRIAALASKESQAVLRSATPVFSNVKNGDPMLTVCLAAGEEWLVPIDLIGDGMNETDFPEERLLEKLPGMVKKEFVSTSGKICLSAFTSLEKVQMAGTEPFLTVRYPATDLLREFTQTDSGKALVLNPSSDAFPLFPQDAVKLLSAMVGVPRAAVLKYSRISIEPRAVIDVQAILDEWNSGWSDNGKEPEKWIFLCCPIMADGRILLLFESCDEVYGSKAHILHVDHTIMRYRVLEYRIGKDGPEELGKYRFVLQDGNASTVILYDGILKASVKTTGSRKETILPMIPTNDDGQFKIYENVRRIVSRSDGSIAVGYYGNLCDEARLPLMVFDGEGKAIGDYRDDHALFCADINLDSKEQIWFHLFPSGEILCLSSDLKQAERHRVALQGFCGFALSDDTHAILQDCSVQCAGLRNCLTEGMQTVDTRLDAADLHGATEDAPSWFHEPPSDLSMEEIQ